MDDGARLVERLRVDVGSRLDEGLRMDVGALLDPCFGDEVAVLAGAGEVGGADGVAEQLDQFQVQGRDEEFDV